MNTFTIDLFQSPGVEQIDDATLFVGTDDSGSFGIGPAHARFVTVLEMGLARVERSGNVTEYLALPGGLLYVDNNRLSLHTRRYWRGSDLHRMTEVLQNNVQAEAERLHRTKSSLAQIEENMLRRLMELERQL